MRHGGVCAKESEKFEDYTYVCIERPRTPFQNIVRQVEPKQFQSIRNCIGDALSTLKKEGAVLYDIL